VIDWSGLFGLLGLSSIGVALLVMGLLSKRLGSVTRAPRYYLGFYVATLMVALSLLARLLNVGRGVAAVAVLNRDLGWVLLYNGIPALAITLGLFVGWRYWSWLLAERN
jgi:hypothetical protein